METNQQPVEVCSQPATDKEPILQAVPDSVRKCEMYLIKHFPHTYRKISAFRNAGDRLTFDEFTFIIETWCEVHGPDMSNSFWKSKVFGFLGITEKPTENIEVDRDSCKCKIETETRFFTASSSRKARSR